MLNRRNVAARQQFVGFQQRGQTLPAVAAATEIDRGPAITMAAMVRTPVRGAPAIAKASRPEPRHAAVEMAKAVHGPVMLFKKISHVTHTRAPHSGQPRATRTRRRSDSLMPGG
jgi:hypothetical protein